MITMLLGGLWHGAAWNFVLWGLYHGTLLVAFRAAERTPLGRMADRLPVWIKVVAMFQITCYGWLLFRAGSFEQIRSFSLALVQNFGVVQWDAVAQVGWLVAPLLIVQLIQAASGRLLFLDWPWARAEYKTVCYACMLYVILFHGATSQSFIYFQF
jgi:D-alanyl-lipoteichoic acid acyltransferase DltB (MBOAT superfamily)